MVCLLQLHCDLQLLFAKRLKKSFQPAGQDLACGCVRGCVSKKKKFVNSA